MTLRFVTSNRNKLKEAADVMRRPLLGVGLKLSELQAVELEPIVRHKARQAYAKLRAPLFVEDTGLIFHAWGHLPGPFVKWFLENMGVEGMVNALAPFDDWSAEAVCMVGYHDGQTIHCFEGRVPGAVVSPAGAGGFGWDALFRPHGSLKTYAQMSSAEKTADSHRTRALRALTTHLESPRPALTRFRSPQAPQSPGGAGPVGPE